ncbi:MAG: T9SS type A sorting domain-containing protein, partial [Chryseobacterium taeanense]
SPAFSGNNFSTFGINNQNELFVAAVNNGKIFRVTTSTLNTNENDLSSQIKIYPNPASKKVFIEGIKDKNTIVEIMNTEGRKVLKESKIENDKSINISGIPAGVYFINLNSGNQKVYSKKLIIQ